MKRTLMTIAATLLLAPAAFAAHSGTGQGQDKVCTYGPAGSPQGISCVSRKWAEQNRPGFERGFTPQPARKSFAGDRVCYDRGNGSPRGTRCVSRKWAEQNRPGFITGYAPQQYDAQAQPSRGVTRCLTRTYNGKPTRVCYSGPVME